MYTFEEISEALEKDKLSGVLYKMERFAQAQGLKALKNWCSWELDGYPKGYQEISQPEETNILKYRTVPIQWKDIYGRPVIIAPQLAFIQRVPVWFGVSEMEGYAEQGFEYSIPSFAEKLQEISNVPLGQGHIAPDVIRSLFDRIRLEAKRRLHNEVPRGSGHSSDISSTQEPGNDLTEATQLFDEVQSLVSSERNPDQPTARLIIEKADDAIKLFGQTHHKEKVQLRMWRSQAERALPPAGVKEILDRGATEGTNLLWPRNRKLQITIFLVIALALLVTAIVTFKKQFEKEPKKEVVSSATPQADVPAPAKAKLIYLMDAADRSDVYDRKTYDAGGTNVNDIIPVLDGLAKIGSSLLTNVPNDQRRLEVINADPDLVITHLGSFYGKTPAEEDLKFDQFLRQMAGKKSKFLIYTRKPRLADDSKISAWISLREQVDSNLKGRIHLFSLANAHDQRFGNPEVSNQFRAEVKKILGVN